MGLSVFLRDEQGGVLEEVHDPTNLLHRLLPAIEDLSFPCLRFVDWYGDTVFNGLQMECVVPELDRLHGIATTREEHDLVAKLERMAERCKSEVHLYLKFNGD